jgi:photosystem II stability/assembly factor-like uncharacterized protein/TolA-binding protein
MPWSIRWFLTLACTGVLALAAKADSTLPDRALAALREDAELTDVQFLDAQQGWAVGDRGVIWHTADGGRTWRLQDSGVACRLESVSFIDPQNGWVAGGTTEPYTHATTGVLLRTRDGGRRWEADARMTLPALKRVKFLNQQVGWALGESSALFPSGAFATDNGGRTWNPLPGAMWNGWLAGDFVDPVTGALAGRKGALATVRRRGLEASRTPAIGLRGLRKLQLDPVAQTIQQPGPQGDAPSRAMGRGWLVGDGNLVLTTEDLGATWQTPHGAWPEIFEQFDWSALFARGDHCWVAGTPGSRIVRTADGGRTWQVQATGQTLPLRAIWFSDPQHGWAVGALGVILATADGGKSWQRQRSGGTRAAFMAAYSVVEAIPVELFAKLSAGEGYLGVGELLGRADVEDARPQVARAADRGRDAIVLAGGSALEAAWQFPLRPQGIATRGEHVTAAWDLANDGAGVAKLEARLVRQIRTWRPDVVFTHSASPRGEDALGHVVNQVVMRAVEKAADPTRYPEQVTQAGLEPWKVRKVFTSLQAGQSGSTQLETAQLMPRLGRSVADLSALPRGLICEDFAPSPASLAFRLSMNALSQETAQRDFFTGIVLHPGGDARRLLADTGAESLDLVRGAAQRQRNVQAILDRSHDSPAAGQLLGQVRDLVESLDGPLAGQVLYQLADRYFRAGQWELAAESFDLLVQKCPEHPLTAAANVWLVQYYASSEATWRAQRSQRVHSAETIPMAGDLPQAKSEVRLASALSIDNARQNDRPAQAIAAAKLLERARPALHLEPALQFPLSTAYRQSGYPRDAERYLLHVRRTRPHDAWWACAEAEAWLAQPATGVPPKPIWHCVSAATKPHLDGKLDDEVWGRAARTPLRSSHHDDAEWPAVAQLAYDEGFLYLAVECRKAPGIDYASSTEPRPRDPDLATHDRVTFHFDLDRDFATHYSLTIDHRGWTGESCWGDRTWNPTWFVAATGTEGNWTAEAAIPLDELHSQFPASKTVWALGVERIVPGAGFQSWSLPASTRVQPEGFGFLVFD